MASATWPAHHDVCWQAKQRPCGWLEQGSSDRENQLRTGWRSDMQQPHAYTQTSSQLLLNHVLPQVVKGRSALSPQLPGGPPLHQALPLRLPQLPACMGRRAKGRSSPDGTASLLGKLEGTTPAGAALIEWQGAEMLRSITRCPTSPPLLTGQANQRASQQLQCMSQPNQGAVLHSGSDDMVQRRVGRCQQSCLALIRPLGLQAAVKERRHLLCLPSNNFSSHIGAACASAAILTHTASAGSCSRWRGVHCDGNLGGGGTAWRDLPQGPAAVPYGDSFIALASWR